MAFATAVDIANRTLQHLGQPHISTFVDQSPHAHECARVYDGLRLDEIAANLWRFSTRRATLRPVGVDSLLWTPATWASGTSYSAGAIVAYAPVGQGIYEGETLYWQTDVDVSGTTFPDADTRWRRWFGSRVVDLYDSDETYNAGEIVIVPAAYAAGTTYSKHQVVRSSTTWYVSLVDSNLGNAVSDTTKWANWGTTSRGTTTWGETAGGTDIPLTYPSCAFYLSLASGNEDNPLATGARWLSLAGTGVALNLFWPVGSLAGQRAYRLPYGFLRRAPSDPRASLRNSLGVPHGEENKDWVLDGDYLITNDAGAITLRFVADVIDVPLMDPAFGEALAARMALALFPRLANERARRRDVERDYKTAISTARRNNGIEIGPVSVPLDTLISVRL